MTTDRRVATAFCFDFWLPQGQVVEVVAFEGTALERAAEVLRWLLLLPLLLLPLLLLLFVELERDPAFVLPLVGPRLRLRIGLCNLELRVEEA